MDNNTKEVLEELIFFGGLVSIIITFIIIVFGVKPWL